MGVEPTAARSARPATDFEDQGTHQGTTTPENSIYFRLYKSIAIHEPCEEANLSM